MGQPSEGLPLQNTVMATSYRCDTSRFRGKVKRYLPPLHMKIGLTKISVIEMDKEREGFGYSRQKFLTTNEAKMKEGIFVGPHGTQPFEDRDFSTELNSAEI